MTTQQNNFDSIKYYEDFSSNPHLDGLSEAQIRELIDKWEMLSLPAQSKIFNQGDKSKYGYFLISGEVSLFHTQKLFDETLTITSGNLFWNPLNAQSNKSSNIPFQFLSKDKPINRNKNKTTFQ